jgi:hypothetical protein
MAKIKALRKMTEKEVPLISPIIREKINAAPAAMPLTLKLILVWLPP